MTTHEISEAVEDEEWQRFRKKLKGLQTSEKLDKLYARLEQVLITSSRDVFRKYEVQIDNYLNALRRGGQLDSNNRVQR